VRMDGINGCDGGGGRNLRGTRYETPLTAILLRGVADDERYRRVVVNDRS
jgi:hypothetical protein